MASTRCWWSPLLALSLTLWTGCDAAPSSGCTTSRDCPTGEMCIDTRCVRSSGDDAGVAPLDGAGGDAAASPDAGLVPPGECTVSPSPEPFASPALELHWRGTGLPFPALEQVIVSPVVIDLVEDGPDDVIPELVFVSYQTFDAAGVLRIVSGRAPHETLMTLAGDGTGPVTDDTLATPSLRFDAHPAAGDLDADGDVEIVAVLEGGGAVAWQRDGSELWRTSALDLPARETTPNASVAIADLDQDGLPEVIIGRVVLDGQTGTVQWTGAGGRGVNGQGPLSCVADVAPTPGMEVVAGNTVYDAAGTVVWRASGTGDGFCAIADLFDAAGGLGRDGAPEVVRVAGGNVYVHDGATGTVRWMRALPACMSDAGQGGAPTIADFDGDGAAEIGVAGAWCYSVLDPACTARDMPAGCFNSGLLWRVDTQDDSSNVTSSTVFDFNGDGAAEVVYNDEQHFLVFDGRDGTELYRQPNPSRTRTEQPIVADVDFDGNADIVFAANQEAGFAGDALSDDERIPGLEIWSSADDSWVGARPLWNQHAYHITNIEPDGSIPRVEPSSWAESNTYRLNLALGDVLAAPDLVGDVGTFDLSRCGEGVLRVCASVRNRGDVRVGPGLEVSFYDGDPDASGVLIGSATTDRAIDARGGTATACVDWASAPTDAEHEVFVRVDSSSGERECLEDNNVASLGASMCRTLM